MNGPTGAECERGLAALGIPAVAIPTRSATRVNVEVAEADGTATEVLEPGGSVREGDVSEMLWTCRRPFGEYGRGRRRCFRGASPGAGVSFYADLIEAARAFVERGAAVALSLGGDGFVWLPSRDSGPISVRPPLVEGCSAVGCGDATLAGFAVGAERGDGVNERAALAAACGAANCLADSPGMISAEEVLRILPLVEVSELVVADDRTSG